MMLLPLLFAFGCDGPGTSEPVDVGARIDALRDLNATHGAAVTHATTMAEVYDAEDHHHSAMMNALDGMGPTFDDIAICFHMDHDPDMGMQNVHGELEQHGDVMRGCETLDAARAEEERHQRAVARALDAVDRNWHRMMSMGAVYPECYGVDTSSAR